MTFVARSPCAKTISLARNLLTFLPRPAESRNDFTSKVEPFETFSWGERRAFADLRRVGGVGIGQTNTETTTCSMLCRLPYTTQLIAIARPCCHCFAPPPSWNGRNGKDDSRGGRQSGDSRNVV